MVIILSLLLIAFVFGIRMGLSFYRRNIVKCAAENAVTPRYVKSRTNTY